MNFLGSRCSLEAISAYMLFQMPLQRLRLFFEDAFKTFRDLAQLPV